MEGAGSIWNKNSWHWEEKNYNKWAKEWLTEHFSALTVTCLAPEETSVNVTKVKKLEGEASLTIRKQKQIHVFHYDVELEFKAEAGDRWTEGKVKVHEFYAGDDEVEVTTTIDKSSDGLPDPFLEAVKKAIKTQLAGQILTTYQDFHAAFKA